MRTVPVRSVLSPSEHDRCQPIGARRYFRGLVNVWWTWQEIVEIGSRGVWILSGVTCSVEHMFATEILASDPELFQSGESEGLPLDLGTIPPGLMLMLVLSGVDRDRLSGFDRVELVKARSRLIAHLQAELLADVESVSEATGELGNLDQPDPDQIFETTVSELRAALCLTRRSAELMVDLAFQLNQRLPRVWEALHAGLIDLGRARVLC